MAWPGLVMILLGLYLGGWWRVLGVTERLGLHLWRRLEPLGRRLLPVRRLPDALLLGFLWAWIPCGLVYSVLISAVSTGSPLARGPAHAGLRCRYPAQPTRDRAPGRRRRPAGGASLAAPGAGLLVIGFGVHALWQLVGGA